MPQIHQMSQEQARLLEQSNGGFSKEDLIKLIGMLKYASSIYESKIGTYKGGYYKQFNERKVRNSFTTIESLLHYNAVHGKLTEKQIKLAKKLVRNAMKIE